MIDIEHIKTRNRVKSHQKLIEIIGLGELLFTVDQFKCNPEFKKSITDSNSIVVVNLGYREFKNRSIIDPGDTVDILVMKAVLPPFEFQPKKLKKIPDELEIIVQYVDFLCLSNNEITSFPNWLVNSKLKLTGIYLNNLKLKDFPTWVRRCGPLKELSLHTNEIKKIEQIEFLNTNNQLEYIDLSDNTIEAIDFHVFNLINLKGINLSYNNIKESPRWDYFRGNKKLERIYLDFWGPEINNIDFRYTPNLTDLSIEGHEIGDYLMGGLGDDIDKGRKALIDKALSDYSPEFGDREDWEMRVYISFYDYIEDLGIYELEKLESLSIACNNLIKLPKEFYELNKLKSLQWLDFRDNNFSEIEIEKIKDNFKNVEHLFF